MDDNKKNFNYEVSYSIEAYKKLQMYNNKVNGENKEIYNLHEGKMINRGTTKFGTLVDTIFSTIKPINSYLVNTEFSTVEKDSNSETDTTTKYFSDHLPQIGVYDLVETSDNINSELIVQEFNDKSKRLRDDFYNKEFNAHQQFSEI